jgi:branched-chain amino acid transport system permease protein
MTAAVLSASQPASPALRAWLVRAASLGLIAGGTVVYMVAIGFIAAAERIEIITDYLNLGTVALLAPGVAFGYAAGRNPASGGLRLAAIGAGLISGFIGGLFVAAFVVLATTFDVHDTFPNVTPDIIATISFGTVPPTTIVLLGVLGTVLGGAGAALNVIGRIPRVVILTAVIATVVMGIMERLLRVSLTELQGVFASIGEFLYSGGGLTVPGAVTVFVVSAVLMSVWQLRRARARAWVKNLDPGPRTLLRRGSVAAFGLMLVALPQVVGPFPSDVLNTAGIYILMGLGLNIVVGFAGLLDLGYVAFYAIGAYTMAFLTSPFGFTGLEISFWAALPIIVIVVAISGLLIGTPVLRLRGDYLAIVTLGFGEIVRILFASDWLTQYTGGAQGVLGIAEPTLINGWPTRAPQEFYYVVLAFVVVAAFVAIRLANSRAGRAWTAMREDEQVAEATGINTTYAKLLAFGLGAVFAGLGGALFASKIGVIFPTSFSILVSITALAIVILGGAGSIRGVIVGALVLTGLPELLREFDDYRLLLYGAVLVAMMLLRPEGLLPNARRRAELHEGEDAEGNPLPVGTGVP